MKNGSAATTLRQIFARIADESGWSTVAEDQAARLAVHAFVDESRADGRPFRDVIMDVLALSGAMSDGVAETARETIAHWVVEAFYPLGPGSPDE